MAESTRTAAASDEDLMVLLRTRDYPAFVALFDRWRSRAVSFAARMTGDADEAEDIAHDAFAKVAAEAARYSVKTPFKIWFLSILRGLVFEQVSERDPGPAARLQGVAAARPSTEVDPSSPQAKEAGRVYDSLNRLKPVYREVVYLRIFERLSYMEIAEITGEKSATVHGRMSYATEHLRKEIVR